MDVHLDKLGAGVEEVGDEVVVDLGEGEVLRAVDAPGHVVTHPGVQTCEYWMYRVPQIKCPRQESFLGHPVPLGELGQW